MAGRRVYTCGDNSKGVMLIRRITSHATNTTDSLKATLQHCLFTQTLRYDNIFILGISFVCPKRALVPVVRMILTEPLRQNLSHVSILNKKSSFSIYPQACSHSQMPIYSPAKPEESS